MVFLLTHGNRGGVFYVVDERSSTDNMGNTNHPKEKLETIHKNQIWDAIGGRSFLQNAFKIYFMGVNITHFETNFNQIIYNAIAARWNNPNKFYS
jgi:hypothetical protein